MKLSSKNRLMPFHRERFPEDTLFGRIARAVCRAGVLPRKELYEAWETARRVRRRFRGGRVVDLACGHGLLAQIMLILDQTSPLALAVDTHIPKSAETLLAAMTDTWPFLGDRICFESRDLGEITLFPGDLVVSAHACGSLTDLILAKAVGARARVAVLPCCHDLETCDTGGLTTWMPPALAVDAARAIKLRAAGYDIYTAAIPAAITPKNRLLMGKPGEIDSLSPGFPDPKNQTMSNIQEIIEETIDVFAEDGVHSAITVFGPQGESFLPVITCFPAMGVSAEYYRSFAHSLAKEGVIVITADLRGIGSSSVRASKQNNFGYFEMIHYDWPAVIKAVKNKFPKNKLFLLGHSLGGQLSSLYLSHQKDYEIAGLILVTVNSVYYKGYGFPDGLKVLAGTNLAYLISLFAGYFPGHTFGFGGLEAKNVIKDWSRQGRTGIYEITNSSLNYEILLAKLTLPVISFSFEGDFFAPSGAAQHLIGKMKNAKVTHVHMQPKKYGLKNKFHFSWAKNPDFIVSLIVKWIQSQIVDVPHHQG